MVVVAGTVAPAFEEVAAAFQQEFEENRETGASLCVYHHGRPVVDLWGGVADGSDPWQQDTLVALASATKGIVAAAAWCLIESGELDLDTPVARYWPEFAAEGKSEITVRWVLSHRSGVAAFARPVAYQDQIEHTPIAEALAAARPEWTPGTAHGYHAFTFGYLLSELIRRITGLTAGRFVATRLARPLDLDLHIGLEERNVARVAPWVVPSEEDPPRQPDPLWADYERALADPASLAYRATFGSTAVGYDEVGDAAYYLAEEPSAGAFGTAAALARCYASLIGDVDGVRLVGPESVRRILRAESTGVDRVLLMQTTFGLGFQLPNGPRWPPLPARVFGQPGATGSLGFADPDNEVAFGYAPARMARAIDGVDSRSRNLAGAVYRCLRR